MKLLEATIQAEKTGMLLRRKVWLPQDSAEPSLKNLLADDWELVERPRDHIFAGTHFNSSGHQFTLPERKPTDNSDWRD